ncbi:MAG: YifB family Mg chelatase-like AAA ATPase [Proteobacteria bacterium]|nr:YifB family Mg chelatase-like AAA ATPase [Pseudomonadota bacterium]
MSVHVRSGCLLGIAGVCVDVEVDILSLLPTFTVVGLPQSSVRESRERVRSAIGATSLRFPRRRITVNLAPADVPKHGSGLDLAIALGVMGAQRAEDKKRPPWEVPPFAVGELALDGYVRPIQGVLPLVEAAAEDGIEAVIVARANAAEAALIPGITVHHVDHLEQAWRIACGRAGDVPALGAEPQRTEVHEPDLFNVRGLHSGRRALEVAAAGGHGLLMEGPPGSGKSMLAKRLTSLLPDLPDAHALEVSRIRSAAGLLGSSGLHRRPPLRAPHHTASVAAVVGGGRPLGPGEVTLAHRGVLFLDEVPEFPRGVLESLRQPLEDRVVTIARASQVHTFPTAFQLVATRNPCPCGMYGSSQFACRCIDAERERYLRRMSGPLMDRIDLVAWVDPVPVGQLLEAPSGESSDDVRARVTNARKRQRARWGDQLLLNADAPIDVCLRHFDAAAKRELEQALARVRGSSRSVQQLVRVAMTLADLTDRSSVPAEAVDEALFLCAGARGWSLTRRDASPPRRDLECKPRP